MAVSKYGSIHTVQTAINDGLGGYFEELLLIYFLVGNKVVAELLLDLVGRVVALSVFGCEVDGVTDLVDLKAAL